MMVVRMLPVCDCGYVFRSGIVAEHIIGETCGLKYVEAHNFTPSYCPACGDAITGVTGIMCVEKPVKKAHWIIDGDWAECSYCHESSKIAVLEHKDFCGACGAIMDEESVVIHP